MKLPTRRPLSARINMTPMIDVTFLLIIFFLLSSRLAQQESLELNLPAAASAQQADERSRPRVSISVSADGSLRVGDEVISPADVGQRLRESRDRFGRNVEVRIRADRDVPYRAVGRVLLACADTDIWNVQFAVFERVKSHPEDTRSRVESQIP